MSSHPSASKTTRRDILRRLGAILLLLTVAGVALAVEQTGDILGTVRDEKQQPLPGVTVTLTGNMPGERTAVTDASGRFAFRGVPPGSYAVKYSISGYQIIQQEAISVNIGRSNRLIVDLTPGAAAETVRVEGAAPLVDTVRTTTQDNYTIDYLEQAQVGIGGRDYLSVIANSPGVTDANGDGNPEVRGSTEGNNDYLIDGVDSTDPVTNTFGTNFIYDAIQEVQFQTGGFNAEFGRAIGGIANVVTKSGGNEFHGTADARYSSEALSSSGDHFDPDEVELTRKEFQATIGGPIMKDKLWFFLGGNVIRNDDTPTDSPTTRTFDGNYYLGKLTWQANPDHRFILQVNGDPSEIDNWNASQLVSKEAGAFQEQGSDFQTLQYQGVFGPHLLVNAQVAHYVSELNSFPQSRDFDTFGQVNFLTGEATENFNDAQYSKRYRNQANASLTWSVPDMAGDHTFKFGGDVQDLKFESRQFIPGGEYDDVAPDGGGTIVPLLYNVDHPVGTLENTGLVTSLFAQDEWRVAPRWTLNLGLRYETYSYDNDKGTEVFNASSIQPRVGASWDITGDAHNVVKGFYGTYADPALLAPVRFLNSRANSQDLFINETIAGYLIGAGPTPVDFNGDNVIEQRAFFTSFGGPGGTKFAHGGNLDPTTVREYQLAYERSLNDVSAISLTLASRKTDDIIEDFAKNPDPTVASPYIIDNIPELTRKAYSAELRYRTRIAKLSLFSSYTWSKSKGHVEYDQYAGTDFDYPVLSVNRYGYLSNDTRHAVKVNGWWDLPWRMQAGFDGRWYSGFPFNVTESAFPYGEEFLKPRGSHRIESFYQLDLDARKGFAIGKTNLTLIASIVNLLDTERVLTVNEQQDFRGEPLDFQRPRRFELGVRWAF